MEQGQKTSKKLLILGALWALGTIVLALVTSINTGFADDTLLHINPNLPGSAEGANPGAIVANLYQAALLVAAFLAFGSIVYAGLQYALSSVPGIKSDAKERIIDALLGLLLLVGAYLLLYIINPAIVLLQNPTLDKIQEVKEGAAPPAGGGNLPPECRGVKNGGCVYKAKSSDSCKDAPTVVGDNAEKCKGNEPQGSDPKYQGCYSKTICQRGTANCAPASDSTYCSPDKLRAAGCRDGNCSVDKLSGILKYESAGCLDPGIPSGSDKCSDGYSWSIGIVQINMVAHGKQLCGIDPKQIFDIYGDIRDRQCKVKDLSAYNKCKDILSNPTVNLAYGCKLFNDNPSCYKDWETTRKKCGF